LKYPLSPSAPLLAYSVASKVQVVTSSTLNTMLREAAVRANLPNLTFHVFRRSAASIAFRAGVPFRHIQAHGTWTSEAIWSYIDATAKSSLLPSFFRSICTTPTARLGIGQS
jgi:integrase